MSGRARRPVKIVHLAGKILSWVGIVLAGLFGLVVAALFGVGHSDWARGKLLATLLPIVQKQFTGKLTVGKLRGDLIFALALEDVALDDADGQAVARARRIEVHYHLLALLHKTLHIRYAQADGLWAHARYLADGQINLAELITPSQTPPSDKPLPYTLRIDAVKLDLLSVYDGPPQKTKEAAAQAARDAVPQIAKKVPAVGAAAALVPSERDLERTQRPDLLGHISAQLALTGTGVLVRSGRIEGTIQSLVLDLQEPIAATVKLRGGMKMLRGAITVQDALLQVLADATALNRLVAPNLRHLQGKYEVDLRAGGPLSAVVADLRVLPPAGQVQVHGVLAANLNPASWRGTVQVSGLDPGAAWGPAPHGEIGMNASAEGKGSEGTVDLANLFVDVIGVKARASGRFDLNGMGDAKLNVAARDLSTIGRAKIPGVPDLAGALELSAHATRSPTQLKVNADATGSDLRVAALGRVQHLAAHLRGDLTALTGEAGVDGSGIVASGFVFDRLTLRASGGDRSADLHVDGQGPYGTTFLAEVHGVPRKIDLKPIALDATLNRLVLSARGQSWQIVHPASIHVGDDIAVRGFALASAGQGIALDGRYVLHGGDLNAEVSAHGLDVKRIMELAAMASAQDVPATRLNLRAHASGRVSNPVADVELDGTSAAVQKIDLEPMSYHLRASYRQRRAEGELAVNSLNKQGQVTDGPKLNGRFDIPLGEDDATAGKRSSRAKKGQKSEQDETPLSAQLALEGVLIERFQRFLPATLAALKGRVALHASAGGTLRRPEVALVLDVPHWEIEDLKNNHSRLNINYGTTRTDPQQKLTASFVTRVKNQHGTDAAAVDASVSLPIDLGLDRKSMSGATLDRLAQEAPLSGRLTVKLDTKTLRGASGVAEARLPINSGTVDGTASFSGTIKAPALDLKVTGKDLATDAVDQLGVQVAASYQGDQAHVDLDASLRGASILVAHGDTTLDLHKILAGAPIADAPVALDAFVSGYELSQATQFAGLLVANVGARGTIAEPNLGVQFSIQGLRAQGLDIGDLQVGGRGTYDGQRVAARFDIVEQKYGTMHLDALAPVRADQPWTINLRSKGFIVDYRSASGLGGVRLLHALLNADLKVGGTRKKPVVAGFTRLQDGSFALATDPSTYKEVQLDASIADGKLVLKDASAKSGDGWVKASGTAQLNGLLPVNADVLAEARHFPSVAGNTGFYLDARVKGHAQTHGDTLDGTVTVLNGTVRLPKLTGQRQLQPVGKTMTDVVFVDTRAQQAAAEKAARAAKAEAEGFPSHIVITASIPGEVYVRSSEVNTAVHGKVEVDMQGSALRMTGAASTLSGTLDLLGKRYDIEQAKVSFGGQLEINPDLDVRITRQSTDAEIIIEVHGSALKPELLLSAQPPIYSQSQIIGIIVGGDPNADPQSNQSLQQKAIGAVSGLILGQLKDQLASKLPIDVLKIDLGDQGYGFESTRLEVGKYLTDELYLSYVHQFGNLTGLTKINANQASLEYHFLRVYSLKTMFGDAAVGALDFFWTHRF